MADLTLQCRTYGWWAFSIVVVAVLLLFTLGVPALIAIVLYNRRDVLGTKETRESLGVLYMIYREQCYWYESVNMLFKIMLWSALVFAEYGSQMQLATALVINVLQLLVMVHLKPFGGELGDDMNFLNGLALMFTALMNFVGFAMSHLELASKYYALLGEGGNEARDYGGEIAALQSTLVVLTLLVGLSFAGVGLKQAVLAGSSHVKRGLEWIRLRGSGRGGLWDWKESDGATKGRHASLEMQENPMPGRQAAAGVGAEHQQVALRDSRELDMKSYRI